MRRLGRGRTTWALAASAAVHFCVLALFLLERHTLPPPSGETTAVASPVIPVLLAPRMRVAATRPSAPPRDGRRRPQLHAAASPERAAVAPLIAAPGLPSQTPPQPSADLRAALRQGAIGCANLGAAGMTRADRERCDEQLAHGVASAPFLPAALEPRIRAYYDAVALAKQRDPPRVAVINKAALPFDPPPSRPGGDHMGAIACRIPFGAGAKPRKLPHALYLGPCFIEPPKGPLDPEVDITPP